MITIYGSTASRAARCMWVLEELGLPYRQDKISIKEGEHRSPSFLAINPAGKVPALADGDVVLSESFAINLYLAQQYGQDRLWPLDAQSQARVLQWSFWAASEMDSQVGPLFMEMIVKTTEERDLAQIERINAYLVPRLAYLDQALTGRSYLLGDRFTLADINVGVVIAAFYMLKVDFTAYPQIGRWWADLRARPARQRVDAMPRP